MIEYKFREDELIAELKDYIDGTYSAHYGQGKLQSSEVIVDRGHGLEFFLGNVDKYNARYGKKGEPADYRKDLVKVLHYGLLALYEHDRRYGVEDDQLSFEFENKSLYSGGNISYNTAYTINMETK
jgi:hypothetical protein